MAATNFQIELPNALPQGGLVRFTNKPSVIPSLGFNVVDPSSETYPSSGTPVTAALGLGTLSFAWLLDATGNNAKDRYLWTAPAPCQVISITFQQSVIENTSATTTAMIQKVPNGQAIAGANAKNLLAAALNLKTGVVANTVLVPALTATAADLILAATDSLALDMTNAVTEYIGIVNVHVNFI